MNMFAAIHKQAREKQSGSGSSCQKSSNVESCSETPRDNGNLFSKCTNVTVAMRSSTFVYRQQGQR